MGKLIDWTVINHMPQGVAFSTDLKIAYFIGMSPSVAEITLGRQTMMCGMARRQFPTGRTGVQEAGEPMVTKTRATVTLGGGGVGVGVLDKDSRGGRGNPLPISDLDADGFIVNYCGGSR